MMLLRICLVSACVLLGVGAGTLWALLVPTFEPDEAIGTRWVIAGSLVIGSLAGVLASFMDLCFKDQS